MRQAIPVVKEALPEADPELIGGFFANLLDLWETGQTLDEKVKEICKMRFPRDLERLHDVLIWIEAIQLDMASYWIGEVKKDSPKLQGVGQVERKLPTSKQKRNQQTHGRQKAETAPVRKGCPQLAVTDH